MTYPFRIGDRFFHGRTAAMISANGLPQSGCHREFQPALTQPVDFVQNTVMPKFKSEREVNFWIHRRI